MPGLDGIEATRRIVQDSPHIAVLALTMLEDDDSVFAAMRAGARGYLLKGTLKAEILRAIQGVASGEAIFGPRLSSSAQGGATTRVAPVLRPARIRQAPNHACWTRTPKSPDSDRWRPSVAPCPRN